MVMLRHVRVRRIVTTMRGAAGLSYTQMYYLAAVLDTLFADIIFGCLYFIQRFDMLTGWIGMHKIYF